MQKISLHILLTIVAIVLITGYPVLSDLNLFKEDNNNLNEGDLLQNQKFGIFNLFSFNNHESTNTISEKSNTSVINDTNSKKYANDPNILLKREYLSGGRINDKFSWDNNDPPTYLLLKCSPKIMEDMRMFQGKSKKVSYISRNSWFNIDIVDEVSGETIENDGFGRDFGFGIQSPTVKNEETSYEKTLTIIHNRNLEFRYSGENVKIIIQLLKKKPNNV